MLSFCGGGGGVVCTVIFMFNPTTVLSLCCVVVGVVTKIITSFIVATNIVASQLPECQPTGTSTARANFVSHCQVNQLKIPGQKTLTDWNGNIF